MLDFICTAVSFVVQTMVLFIVLWIILRIQKTDYSRAGLFGSTVLATALDYIPYYGHFAAVVVVVWILEKMTHDKWSHVIVTVLIGYGIKFCFTFWILGLLLGSLRSELETVGTVLARNDSTNTVSVAMSSGSATSSEIEIPPDATSVRQSPPPGGYPTNEVPTALLMKAIGFFSTKGIIRSARPSAIIDSGVRTYNICPADLVVMQTSLGRVTTLCDGFTNDAILLHISGIPVKLDLPTNRPATMPVSGNPK